MKKLTRKEIADEIVKVTLDASQQYCEQFEKKSIDKKFWAFLHIGFVGGLKLCGYDEDFLMKSLEIAQKELEK